MFSRILFAVIFVGALASFMTPQIRQSRCQTRSDEMQKVMETLMSQLAIHRKGNGFEAFVDVLNHGCLGEDIGKNPIGFVMDKKAPYEVRFRDIKDDKILYRVEAIGCGEMAGDLWRAQADTGAVHVANLCQ